MQQLKKRVKKSPGATTIHTKLWSQIKTSQTIMNKNTIEVCFLCVKDVWITTSAWISLATKPSVLVFTSFMHTKII
jgi:hypothetical protein